MQSRSRLFFMAKTQLFEFVWTGSGSDLEEDGTAVANFKESRGINYLEANTAKQNSTVSKQTNVQI